MNIILFACLLIHIIRVKRYKQNVQVLNQVFKDRPMSPRSLVAYWTQYVIDHNGAEHLRSEASETSWVYYYLLDILLSVMLISISSLIILLYLVCMSN